MTDYIEHKVKGKVERFFKGLFKGIFIGIAIIAFMFLFGYITMRLWNWLMPEIFGLTTLTYWQAFGILVLAKIFFGGFGDHSSKKEKKKSGKRYRFNSDICNGNDLSNWKYYDSFWKEEGEKAFNNYVNRQKEEDLS